MKIYKYIFIPLFAIAFIFSACSKADESKNGTHSIEKQKELYTCPMHPEIKSDKPGACPICNMDLIKKVAEEIKRTAIYV